MASVLFACIARHLWSGRERAGGRRVLSAGLQRGTPRAPRVGPADGVDARVAGGLRAREPRVAPWTGADRTPGSARDRCGHSVVTGPDYRSRTQSPRRRPHRCCGRRVHRRPPEGSHRRLEALTRRARCFRPRLGDRVMPERTVQIVNRNGLHARPAAEIVKLASKFQAEITIVKDDLDVNGKSIMGVMMLAAEHGSTILLRAEGPDADAAIEALATLVGNKFGER